MERLRTAESRCNQADEIVSLYMRMVSILNDNGMMAKPRKVDEPHDPGIDCYTVWHTAEQIVNPSKY